MPRKSYNYYDDYFFESSGPLEAPEGIKARSQRGAFTKNWWANRWIEAMERLMDPGRLGRGRTYARKGQVLSVEETRNGVKARVQGSRPTPYKVTIRVEPLNDAQWEKVIDVLAGQSLFAAQLLAGEMPQDIEEAFSAAGESLFPARRGDLVTDCSCPDWANPCKHVAAAHYILGERIDDDPFLLFRLRGRTQEQILLALRQRRAGEAAPEEDGEEEGEIEAAPPLEAVLDRFWELGEPLDNFPLVIKAPAIESPLLKRLGPPPFLPDPPIESLLGAPLRLITRSALAAAFGSEEEDSE